MQLSFLSRVFPRTLSTSDLFSFLSSLSSLSSAQSWFSSPTKWKISLFCVLGSWIFLFLELFLLLFESLVCLFLAAVIRVEMSQSWMDSCKSCRVQMINWGTEASDKDAEDSLAELGTELCFIYEAILLSASGKKFSIFIVTLLKFFLDDFWLWSDFRSACPFCFYRSLDFEGEFLF